MTNRSRPEPPENETREESRRRYEAAADASLAMFEKAHPMNPATPGNLSALNSARRGWPIYRDSRGNLYSACGTFLGTGTPPVPTVHQYEPCEDYIP